MPMRQPCGSSAPACSPATSSGVVPSASTSLPLARKRTRPPSPPRPAAAVDGPEALEVQPLGDAGALEAVGQRVQQAGRTAGPGLGARASRARAGRARRRPTGRPDRRGARAACSGGGARASARRSPPKIASSGDGATCTCAASGRPPGRRASARSIPMTGVTPLPAVTNSSGCSMASGRTNSPVGGASRTSMPAARMADEVLGHQSARDALDGDRDATVAPPRHRRERIGAPVPNTVDVDADANVLARHMRGPAAARPQPQRHAVARLGHHGFDAAARLARRPERVQLAEEVVREKRCGENGGCIEKADD